MIGLLPLDHPCPCRSGRTAGECCMPEGTPVSRRGQHFNSLKVELKALDERGMEVRLPKDLSAEASLKPPHQLDGEVEAIIDSTYENLGDDLGHLKTWVRSADGFASFSAFGHKEGAVFDSLYAVRYHQQQFFARLRLVSAEQLFATEAVRGPNTIRILDVPLECELEAFLLRTRGLLDALAKAATFALGKKERTHGAFQAFLRTDQSLSEGIRNAIRKAYEAHRNWIEQVDEIRNAVLHDGEFRGFTPIAHQHGRVVDAEVGGVRAGGFAIRVWMGLRELIPAVIRPAMQGASGPQ